MHPLLRHFLRMNWPLFGLMMGLLAFGIYAIHSATWMRDQDFAKSQLIWIVICMPMFFIVSLIDYRWVRFGAIPLYVASILGLVATMFIGEKRYGARSWLDLGPMSFQPSQLAIIAGILTLSLFLSNTRAMPAFLRESASSQLRLVLLLLFLFVGTVSSSFSLHALLEILCLCIG